MNVKTAGSLSCGICKDGPKHKGTEGLGSHFRNCHDPLQSYPCGQLECGKKFITKSSMIRHIATAHLDLFEDHDGAGPSHGNVTLQPTSPGSFLPTLQDYSYDNDDDTFSVCFEESAAETSAKQQNESLQDQLNNAAVQMLLDLRSKASLTGKAIERFESGCNCMIQQFCGSLKEILTSRLILKGLTKEDAAEILKDLVDVQDPFENLKSIEQQLDYFEKKFGLVKPEEKYLGDRLDRRLDPQSNTYVQTQVTESFQYVPIIKTLKAILSNKKNRNRIFKDLVSKDGVLRSFVDGSKFKDHPFLLKHKNVVHILLFYDELEIANSLGSKTIIHKLACFFFQVLNLPAEASSELSSIHLLALAYADDMKRPGAFKKVLAPFCTDMKKLASEEGVTLDLDGEPFVLRAILTNLTADTLAAHDLLGFLSVGANYFCRRCMVSRAEVRANANAVGIPRTPELHAAHLEQVQQRKKFSSECGVKRSCPLDDIPYFHCVENNVFDAFHDLLEGVVPLVIKLVLRHYITKRKIFNVKYFNGLVVSFDYGLPDSKNKPSPNFDLDMLTSPRGKLKQTGSQMWCLMRALPFILGDLVEEGDPHMNLIFLLQDIMQIIFSFEIQNGDADRLDTLIYNHNALFFTLFIETQELHEEEDEQGLDEQEVDGADNEQGVVTQDVDEEDNQQEVHEQEVDGEDSEQGVDEEELVEEEGLLEEETEQEQTVGKSARNKNKKNNKKKKNSKKKKKKVYKIYVTNKLHHLKHYGDMVREVGPPVRVWCAKFEGRMKIFRQHAAICCCFKNPPMTMARMFQLSNLKSIISECVECAIDYQNGKSVQLSEVLLSPHGKLFVKEGFTGKEELIFTRSATVNGEEYRPGLFVCLPGSTPSRLLFALICDVVVVDKKAVYLVLKPWANGGISAKYNACHVFPLVNPDLQVMNVLSLANFRCIAPWTVDNHPEIYLSLRTTIL